MFGIMAYKGGDRMIRVAICDDDKHMQESLSKYLLDIQYNVTEKLIMQNLILVRN